MSELAEVKYMSQIEARKCANGIKASLDNARDMILALHDRKGWRALGYKSWRDCVTEEFGQSKTHLYRQLDAAKIELEISPMGEKLGQLPERPLRELKAIPAGERKEVFEQAKAESNGKTPTAAKVREIVDHKLARVNGHAAPDPPDIAKARKAGVIPANAVVDVHEPDEVTDLADTTEAIAEEAAAGEDALSDGDWLASLPLFGALRGTPLKVFSADAIAYRELEKPRVTFRHHAARVLKDKDKGVFAHKVKRFLRLDHPKSWLRCPTTENGGCGGTGAVPALGECPKCKGKGYWING
jgi:hypothetical protein